MQASNGAKNILKVVDKAFVPNRNEDELPALRHERIDGIQKVVQMASNQTQGVGHINAAVDNHVEDEHSQRQILGRNLNKAIQADSEAIGMASPKMHDREKYGATVDRGQKKGSEEHRKYGNKSEEPCIVSGTAEKGADF